MYKIDLSLENCLKTKMIDGKIRVRDYKPKYNYIEAIITDGENDAYLGVYPMRLFVEKFGKCRIISVHDYDDTGTTSIVFHR